MFAALGKGKYVGPEVYSHVFSPDLVNCSVNDRTDWVFHDEQVCGQIKRNHGKNVFAVDAFQLDFDNFVMSEDLMRIDVAAEHVINGGENCSSSVFYFKDNLIVFHSFYDSVIAFLGIKTYDAKKFLGSHNIIFLGVNTLVQ